MQHNFDHQCAFLKYRDLPRMFFFGFQARRTHLIGDATLGSSRKAPLTTLHNRSARSLASLTLQLSISTKADLASYCSPTGLGSASSESAGSAWDPYAKRLPAVLTKVVVRRRTRFRASPRTHPRLMTSVLPNGNRRTNDALNAMRRNPSRF